MSLLVQLMFLVALCFGLLQSELVSDREVELHNVPENWFRAYELCRSHQMQLLTIKSAQDNIKIVNLLRKHNLTYTWLAATDLALEGEWTWTPSGTKITNMLWRKFQPDNFNESEHCLQINADFPELENWNDNYCSRKYTYCCESVPSLNNEASNPCQPIELPSKFAPLPVHLFVHLNLTGVSNTREQEEPFNFVRMDLGELKAEN